ncbi:hypothetical protein EJB05_25926, partial [Eragrostis curvula]
MAFRRLALRLSEAAHASSSSTTRLAAAATPPGASSASADVLAVYVSEAVLAALRTSVGSAARRAAVARVISAPRRSGLLDKLLGAASASKLEALEQPRLPSAADPSASSSPTAPPPPAASASGSIIFALYASEWARSSLHPSSTAASAALGEDLLFLAPPTTASGILLPTAAAARAAAHMPPVAAFRVSYCYPPSQFARACSTRCWEVDDSSLQQSMMLRTMMSFEDNVMLRADKFSQKKLAVVERYLQSHVFTSDELFYLLVALKDDEWHANVDAKLDEILVKLDKSGVDTRKLLTEVKNNNTRSWTTVVIAGKKIDLSSWATWVLSFVFGAPMP